MTATHRLGGVLTAALILTAPAAASPESRTSFRSTTDGKPNPAAVHRWTVDDEAQTGALTFATTNLGHRSWTTASWISTFTRRQSRLSFEAIGNLTSGASCRFEQMVRLRSRGKEWGPWFRTSSTITAGESANTTLGFTLRFREARAWRVQWRFRALLESPGEISGDLEVEVK